MNCWKIAEVCNVKVGDEWSVYYVLRFKITIHPAHDLCPSCVPEKVGINK